MSKKKITEQVEDSLKDFLDQNGLELYNTEFVKEGKDWFLRVYIDKKDHESYVGTEDCEKVSRYLDEIMEEKDPIDKNYYLEVSSPGMDRELTKPEHFERYIGQIVEIKLYKGLDGRKQFEGELKGLIDGNIIIIENGEEKVFRREDVSKINLAVIF